MVRARSSAIRPAALDDHPPAVGEEATMARIEPLGTNEIVGLDPA